MVKSIYFLKPAWCRIHLAGLWPEQGLQPVTRATALQAVVFTRKHTASKSVRIKFNKALRLRIIANKIFSQRRYVPPNLRTTFPGNTGSRGPLPNWMMNENICDGSSVLCVLKSTQTT